MIAHIERLALNIPFDMPQIGLQRKEQFMETGDMSFAKNIYCPFGVLDPDDAQFLAIIK